MENENAVTEEQVEAPVESAPTEETPVEATETDSEVAENTPDAQAEGHNVPYDRFSQVNEEKKRAKEEAEYWKNLAMQSAPQKQKPQSANEIPEYLIQEDGTIDPIGYAQWVEDRAEKRVAAKSAEERSWNEASKVYPELDSDPDLRDSVYGYMLAQVGKGQYLSPKQAADKLLGKFKAARQEGIKAAQTSEKVQKTATVQVTGTAPAPSDPMDEARAKGIQTGDFEDFFQQFAKKVK
jgi:hypothetical protein